MNIISKIIIALIAVNALSACQSNKLNSNHSASTIEPRLTNEQTDINKEYLWGGEILAVENLQQTTELTIISYPLDRNEKPNYKKQSTGRFIASYPGFLEPTDYRTGQSITIIGTLQKFRDGKVAQADYQFPVLSADRMQLHAKASKGYRLPFTIGIGIGIHN